VSLSSRNRSKGDGKGKEGREMGRRGEGRGKGERKGKGKETNHVPVSSLQQVFAAVTWSAGPPAKRAPPETKGRSVIANMRKSVESCILNGNSK
jgi:hypothetical protein